MKVMYDNDVNELNTSKLSIEKANLHDENLIYGNISEDLSFD